MTSSGKRNPDQYFIVLRTCRGVTFPRMAVIEIPRGFLAQLAPDKDRNPVLLSKLSGQPNDYYLKTFESSGPSHSYFRCPENDLIELDLMEASLLRAENDAEERFLFTCQNRTLLKSIKVGSNVTVSISGMQCPGTVHYIGNLDQSNPGAFLGVELLQNGIGNCDGTFKRKRYFSCGQNRGQFVPVTLVKLTPLANNISANRPLSFRTAMQSGHGRNVNEQPPPDYPTLFSVPQHQLRSSVGALPSIGYSSASRRSVPVAESRIRSIPIRNEADVGHNSDNPSRSGAMRNLVQTTINLDAESDPPRPRVSVGDRVVWVSDTGPSFGTVRWIGMLPDTEERHAGVEFDDAIGTGTGTLQGRRYFEARLHHASFVPLLGLMLEEDFIQRKASQASNALMNGGSSLKNGIRSPDRLDTPSSSDVVMQQPRDTFSRNDSMQERSVAIPNLDHVHLGSCVKLRIADREFCGVVRWVGVFDSDPTGEIIAGIECEEDLPYDFKFPTNGIRDGVCYFETNARRGVFTAAAEVSPDDRFDQLSYKVRVRDFGGTDSPIISSYTEPLTSKTMSMICGDGKGIQGHHNSCYLDATLFAMFTFTDAFDGLLLERFTRKTKEALVQKVLAEEIVYPLRSNCFVRADHVNKFRMLLSELLPDIAGLTEEEKDPEELIDGLLGRILKAPPYVKMSEARRMTDGHSFYYSSKHDSHICQLVVEKTDSVVALPTVQYLLETSLFHLNLSFEQIPPIMIIQLPRYGKERIYDRIVPSLTLDLTHLVTENPRPCSKCGRLADFECKECFLTRVVSIGEATFCDRCFEMVHRSNQEIRDHSISKIQCHPLARKSLSGASNIPTVRMDLVSVLCIDTSHYVSFARTDVNLDAPWCVQDSMADRKGGAAGYNIPRVTEVADVSKWLSQSGIDDLTHIFQNNTIQRNNNVPPYVERLLKDCYFAFYVRADSKLYR